MVASQKNLYDASHQWAMRPNDERFWTLGELRSRMADVKNSSCPKTVDLTQMEFSTVGDRGLLVKSEKGGAATLSHFAFGQISGLIGAPVGYLRQLPAPMVADQLNWGMKNRIEKKLDTSILFSKRADDLSIRAITSTGYGRIWNVDVVDRLCELPKGWRTAPARPSNDDDPRARPALESDCLVHRMEGLGIKPGDMIAPAGLYGSDKDMFCFLVNEERQIQAGKSNLCRGFFIENSEVGDRALKITTFLYNGVCGNHIVWGAENVNRIRIVHKGQLANQRAWDGLRRELINYSDASALGMENRIRMAQNKILGSTRAEVVEVLYNKRLAPQKTLEAGAMLAEQHPEDGHDSPRSVWGMVQGLTRLAQKFPHADKRVEIDRVAQDVLALAN